MRVITLLFSVFTALFCLGLGALFFLITSVPINLEQTQVSLYTHPTIVLDEHNQEWARFQLDQREPITLATLPPHVINAFLAAEDHQFFHHNGISWRGIARSLWINLTKRRFAQGASTITQQLVKLLFFSRTKTVTRKIKEQITALLLEYHYTKEQILEAYLNIIYCGAGIYGIQAAAQRFWKKDAQQLTVAQAALVAGLVQSPSYYCPLLVKNHAACLARRNNVLKRMLHHAFISQEEYDQAIQEPLDLVPDTSCQLAPHAREMIRQQAEALVGREQLYKGGLIIKTTLNKDMQAHAQAEFEKHIAAFRKRNQQMPLDGAVVTCNPHQGAIRVLIGGYNFEESEFNRAKARRPIGSLIKPFLYIEALRKGRKLSDVEIDEPITSIANWNPQNVTKKFEGPMTLAHTLSVSNNSIPIKIFLELGAEKIISLLKQCHLPGPFVSYPSLALGCTEASLLDMTAAYSALIAEGVYHQPYLIEWIKDHWGKKIWRHQAEPEQIISFGITSQMIQTLKLVPQNLSHRLHRPWITTESIGKTGTTNDVRSCWYIGATPNLITGVYLGCDNNMQLNRRASATLTAVPLWLDIHQQFQTNVYETFFLDQHLHTTYVHRRTGQNISPDHPEAIKLLIP